MKGICMRPVIGAITGLLLAMMAGPAKALIIIERPGHELPNHPALRLAEHTVNVKITDRVAEVTAEFVYLNSSGVNLEGTFLFPLPAEAAVDKFSLFVNGEEIAAQLLDRAHARQIYEGIVRRQRDPALLEFAGQQLLQARIFPITPQDGAKVRLYYTHPVPADFGVADFVYPLSVERLEAGSGCKTIITIDLHSTRSLKTVYSPTHLVELVQSGDSIARVTCTPKANGRQSADFHLLAMTARDHVAASFLTCEDPEGARYFMGMISPGMSDDEEILPKDLVFCLDRSGSMEGDKLMQAREALRYCLNRLGSEDQFALVVFSSDIEIFRSALCAASAENKSAAAEFFAKRSASGGTYIDGALSSSLKMFEANNRPKYLVFLTDGLPTVGTRDAGEIRRHAKGSNDHKARVFTWGVGYDLNAGLLNDLAEQGQGVASYVKPGQDIEVEVSHFFEKINRPVLGDCRLSIDGVTVTEMYPRELPDLFAGSEVIVVGRYTGGSPVTATLTGRQRSTLKQFVFATDFKPHREKYSFLPKLWAARRVGYLLEDMRRNGESREVIDEVVALSKKHGIMTPYTSFLAAPEQPGLAGPIPDMDKSITVTGSAKRSGQPDEAATRRSIRAEMLKNAPTTVAEGFAARAPDQEFGGMSIVPPKNLTSPKTIGGKTFALRGEMWTDAELLSGLATPVDTIAIEVFSEAFFELLRACPILQSWLSVGEHVALVIDGVVLIVDEQGATVFREAWRSHLHNCGQIR